MDASETVNASRQVAISKSIDYDEYHLLPAPLPVQLQMPCAADEV